MNKLMSANLSRLWKDKVFWIAAAGMLVYSAFNMLHSCRQATMDTVSEFPYTLDHYFFNSVPLIGLCCAIVTSLFLGTEYSDGAIRNKLVVGHTRSSVYSANLLTSMITSLFFVVVWFVGALTGIPTLGAWKMGIAGILTQLLIAILFTAAFSAIFTFVAMAFTNKAASAVLALLVFFGLIILASSIYAGLNEEELTSGIVITSEGMSMADPAPNPRYISGIQRKIYEFAMDFLPTGQSIQMADMAIAHPVRMMLSSVAVTVLASFSGIWMFRKKDLK